MFLLFFCMFAVAQLQGSAEEKKVTKPSFLAATIKKKDIIYGKFSLRSTKKKDMGSLLLGAGADLGTATISHNLCGAEEKKVTKPSFWAANLSYFKGHRLSRKERNKADARSVLTVGLVARAWKKQREDGRLIAPITSPSEKDFGKNLRILASNLNGPLSKEENKACENLAELLKREYRYNLSQGSTKPYSKLSDIQVTMRDYNNTALGFFIKNGYSRLAALAICTGANINQQDIYGRSVFHKAVGDKNKAVGRLLLAAGAEVGTATIPHNLFCLGGATPLHTFNPDFIETILEKRPDMVHQVDDFGRTPLHIVVIPCEGRDLPTMYEIVTDLCAGGADIYAKDCDGREPMHLFLRNRDVIRNMSDSNYFDLIKNLLADRKN